jgi:hypothetical protein
MSNSPELLATNPTESPDTAFTEIPLQAASSAVQRQSSRLRWLIPSTTILLILVVTAVAYLSRPEKHVDPNAPRVVMEVSGMHCPIQCGLRVSSALETLPWVVPESVTANTKTGQVTFAVTNADAVNQEDIRRVIDRTGFRIKTVQIPGTSSNDVKQGSTETGEVTP